MPVAAPHVRTVPASGIRRVLELAWTVPDAIVLCVGEPDLPTAPHVLAAARDALDRDDTRYTPNGGVPALRDALAAWLDPQHAPPVRRDSVWVTAGGAQALHLGLSLTVGAGDGVLVPDPGYPPFTMATRLLQAEPQPYVLRAEDGFLPDPAAVEAAVTDRTRVLLLNSPSNPLGTTLPAGLLAELVDVARRHDLWVLSDECYAAFPGDAPHVPAARFDTDGRVLTVHTFSKTHAMTGFRVGALVVPDLLAPLLPHVQEAVVSCVNTPAQYAALAALTGPQDAVDHARRTYREHRALATAVLDGRGIPWLDATGGLYLWADVSHATGGDVAAWTEDLVRREGVAVAPGSAFGAAGEGWVRISLTAGADDLRRGLSRLPARG
ncbi:pyridoxal phosphate-dependent aminotransferase [Cellulomonas sp. ES6]|uniref:pyridoxal phosphate-dependent aminotransferase n=1 Tax=Cellulomonas sp. ES6 TaxID=3039384 RepID=UPI0024B64CF0|nr:pyridoxal phosphate-dependent aminotransferase [Cellulomonas sp. ES6]WHP19323.1 pyridoxal phosphate-dependent aminotransferase [Cellulomonas sp. ES6]